MTKTQSYKKTHPWITFKANLDMAPPGFWILVGEAKAKCNQISDLPLKPEMADYLKGVYLTKGVSGTTAIEGNTLTEKQVKERIEGKLKLPPSQEYLGQEIDNVLRAINLIASEVRRETKVAHITIDRIKKYNKELLNNLKLEEEVVPGEIRKYSVTVMRYRGAPAEDCFYLIERLCAWLNGSEFDYLDKEGEGKTVSAIFKAIIAHLYIAWIHPFGDGNGRVARLIEFLILFQFGVPDIAAHLLSNHYNLTRTDYYRQLDYASKSGGNIVPFIQYALQGFVDGLRLQLNDIKLHQWSVYWQNYVHESFQAKSNTKTNKRRRNLVLALSNESKPVPISKIRTISPIVATDYANRQNLTLARDLNFLKKLDLIIQGPEGYRAKKEKVLAFLPIVLQPSP